MYDFFFSFVVFFLLGYLAASFVADRRAKKTQPPEPDPGPYKNTVLSGCSIQPPQCSTPSDAFMSADIDSILKRLADELPKLRKHIDKIQDQLQCSTPHDGFTVTAAMVKAAYNSLNPDAARPYPTPKAVQAALEAALNVTQRSAAAQHLPNILLTPLFPDKPKDDAGKESTIQ